MLIQELLSLLEDQNFTMEFVLNEDLGNFKGLHKGFLSVFKQYGQAKNKLMTSLGRNSPFSSEEAKTTADAIRKFEDPKVVGFVIQLKNGDQVIAVAKSLNGNGNPDGEKVNYIVDGGWLKEKNPAAFEKAEKTIGSLWKAVNKDHTYNADTVAFPKIHALMTAIIRAAKDNQLDPQIVLISKDAQRAAKGQERAAAKSGYIPTPKELKSMSSKEQKIWGRKFQEELRTRLDKYKSNKAVDVPNPNEALKMFVEKGYLDKIKIDGIVYHLYNERINFKGMKGDKFYGESYIEYKVEDDDPKFVKLRREQYKKSKELDENPNLTDKEKMEEIEKSELLLPPRRIKIILGLKGAAIQPTGEIQFDSF